MKKIMHYINNVEEKTLVGTFACSVILIFLQVIMRKVFNNSLSWSEELARYLFVWQCWVGVSLAERHKLHIRITVLRQKLPASGRKILEIMVCLILLGIALALVFFGLQMSVNLMGFAGASPALRIPMFLVYLALPVGSALYALRMLLYMVGIISGKELIS